MKNKKTISTVLYWISGSFFLAGLIPELWRTTPPWLRIAAFVLSGILLFTSRRLKKDNNDE